MQTRILELPLDAFGAHPRPARVEIAVLSLANSSGVLACAADQAFTVMGRFRLPRTLHCSACRRELQLG